MCSSSDSLSIARVNLIGPAAVEYVTNMCINVATFKHVLIYIEYQVRIYYNYLILMKFLWTDMVKLEHLFVLLYGLEIKYASVYAHVYIYVIMGNYIYVN